MINKSEQTPENRIITELADMRRDIEAMKARQLLGSDNLNVAQAIGGSLTTVYTAGMVGGVVINIYGTSKKLYLSELKLSFYLGTDNSDNFAWPYGASILPASFDLSVHYDMNRSDETGAGNKTYTLRMANTSASTYTLYMHYAIIYPSQTLSGV